MNRLDNLIRSMSRNEKGYFKKYASRHGADSGSKYVDLFDLIQSSEVYDEEKIKASFRDDKFVKHLPVAKKYLYDQIIRSLQAYQGEKTLQKKIDWLLDKAEILFLKELIAECKQALKQARKLAYEIDAFSSILRIIDLEKKITGIYHYRGIYSKISELLEEEREIFSILQNVNDYQVIYYKVFETIKKDRTARSKEDIENLHEIMKSDILQDISNARSHRARITHCSTWTFYYDLTGEFENSYAYAEQLIQTWESRPAMIKENTGKYISSLQNFMNRCLRLDKHNAYWQTINKLMDIQPNSKQIEVRQFETIQHFKLLYYTLNYDEPHSIEVIEEIEKGLDTYGDMIKQNFYNLFCFNISNHFIRSGDFDRAMDWVIRINNVEKQDIQQDLRHFNMMNNMIIYYETDNFESLSSIVRSATRYYQNEGKMYNYEKLVLDFMKKALANWKVYGFKEVYKEYHQKCLELEQDPAEKRLFEYFDFRTWLESKITGKRMIDLYLERN